MSRLPWKTLDVAQLPNNKSMAINRLNGPKRSFKDSIFFLKYKDQINDYVDKGFARNIPHTEDSLQDSQIKWYLPHHGVMYPRKKNCE